MWGQCDRSPTIGEWQLRIRFIQIHSNAGLVRADKPMLTAINRVLKEEKHQENLGQSTTEESISSPFMVIIFNEMFLCKLLSCRGPLRFNSTFRAKKKTRTIRVASKGCIPHVAKLGNSKDNTSEISLNDVEVPVNTPPWQENRRRPWWSAISYIVHCWTSTSIQYCRKAMWHKMQLWREFLWLEFSASPSTVLNQNLESASPGVLDPKVPPPRVPTFFRG